MKKKELTTTKWMAANILGFTTSTTSLMGIGAFALAGAAIYTSDEFYHTFETSHIFFANLIGYSFTGLSAISLCLAGADPFVIGGLAYGIGTIVISGIIVPAVTNEIYEYNHLTATTIEMTGSHGLEL